MSATIEEEESGREKRRTLAVLVTNLLAVGGAQGVVDHLCRRSGVSVQSRGGKGQKKTNVAKVVLTRLVVSVRVGKVALRKLEEEGEEAEERVEDAGVDLQREGVDCLAVRVEEGEAENFLTSLRVV